MVRDEIQSSTQQLATSIAMVLKKVGTTLLEGLQGVSDKVENVAQGVQKLQFTLGDSERSLSQKVGELDVNLAEAVQGLKSLRDKMDMAEAKRLLDEIRHEKVVTGATPRAEDVEGSSAANIARSDSATSDATTKPPATQPVTRPAPIAEVAPQPAPQSAQPQPAPAVVHAPASVPVPIPAPAPAPAPAPMPAVAVTP